MWFQLANQFQRRRLILLCLTNQVLELSLVAILFHLWEQNMYFCRGLSIHHDCIQCSLVPISHVFSENIFFCIWSIRNLILPWWPFCLTDQNKVLYFLRELSIYHTLKVLFYLATDVVAKKTFYCIWPIRNFNCLSHICWLASQNKWGIYASIYYFYKVWFQLAK